MMLEGAANSLPGPLQNLVQGGYLAVQTFFVLSGFVLARTYWSANWKRDDLVRYAVARVARIYPVYLLSLVVVAPFILQTLMKTERSGRDKTALLIDYGFLLQGWMGNLRVGWNTPAWTLTCEFFFYLFFPVLFISIRKVGRAFTVAIMAATFCVPALLAHAGVPASWKPIFHMSDFAAGIASARLFEWVKPYMLRRGIWLYLPAILVGAFLIIDPRVLDGTYGDLSAALRLLNALALIGFSLGGGLLARTLASKSADFLGKISYAMYILHVPVLWWYSDWAMHGSWHMPSAVAAILYLAIVIVLSTLVFRTVEVPANRWLRGLVATARPQPVPISLAAAA